MRVREERLSVQRDRLREDLLPHLLGQVFHVTPRAAYPQIRRSGAIRNNRDEHFAFTYAQSGASWGRQQGYICLFDLRALPEGELEWALRKYYFLDPFDRPQSPVFLFVSSQAAARVIPWTAAPRTTMFIPHAECWFPGDLPTSLLSHALVVSLKEA